MVWTKTPVLVPRWRLQAVQLPVIKSPVLFAAKTAGNVSRCHWKYPVRAHIQRYLLQEVRLNAKANWTPRGTRHGPEPRNLYSALWRFWRDCVSFLKWYGGERHSQGDIDEISCSVGACGAFLWSLRCYSSPTEGFRGSSGGYKDPLEVLNDPNEAPGNMSGAQTGYTSISGICVIKQWVPCFLKRRLEIVHRVKMVPELVLMVYVGPDGSQWDHNSICGVFGSWPLLLIHSLRSECAVWEQMSYLWFVSVDGSVKL